MKICALTVRQLKPGSYDAWRQAWWPDDEADEMPEGGEIYIVRNLKNPDEIIAFGLFEGEHGGDAGDDGPGGREEAQGSHGSASSSRPERTVIYDVIEHIRSG